MVRVFYLRVLGAVGLSRLTDESTSPERQREQIELTTAARGGGVCHLASSSWPNSLGIFQYLPEPIRGLGCRCRDSTHPTRLPEIG